MNQWISVKEKLPESHVSVAVLFSYLKGPPTHGYGINCMDKINTKDQWAFQPEEIEITHWTPLPKRPKEKQ